jgi:hypothetical protein
MLEILIQLPNSDMDRVPILIKKTHFSSIRVIGTMELKKRQLAKLLHFYLEMELNILVIFLKVKSQDKV